MRIATLPGLGSLALDGNAVSVNDAVPAADLGDLAFTPVADGNGDAYTTFMFKVSDGVSDSNAAYTLTLDVTATADAPVITTTSPISVAENTTAVTALTATDADADALTWSKNGGADAARFGLTSAGVLTFASAPDYENPTDSGADNGYAVTVRVSDGTATADLALTVNVTDADEPPTIVTGGIAVTSNPASGDTYGTGGTIAIGVTFDRAVDVTGTPEFEFSLKDSGAPENTERATLTGGAGTTVLVFSYTVQAGDSDDNGIWIGDQDRTLKLDSGDTIQGTVGGLDAVLAHAALGTQSSHKVDGQPVANVAPAITTTSPVSVAENTTAVTTLTATDADDGHARLVEERWGRCGPVRFDERRRADLRECTGLRKSD